MTTALFPVCTTDDMPIANWKQMKSFATFLHFERQTLLFVVVISAPTTHRLMLFHHRLGQQTLINDKAVGGMRASHPPIGFGPLEKLLTTRIDGNGTGRSGRCVISFQEWSRPC
jgi:hypothetical protein